jgi:hypothetical protein
MTRPLNILNLMLLTALLSVLSGCSKLTPENYSKLEVGMEYAEVVEIIGQPSECSAVLNAQSCQWTKGGKQIQAKLVADKVVFLSSRGL